MDVQCAGVITLVVKRVMQVRNSSPNSTLPVTFAECSIRNVLITRSCSGTGTQNQFVKKNKYIREGKGDANFLDENVLPL